MSEPQTQGPGPQTEGPGLQTGSPGVQTEGSVLPLPSGVDAQKPLDLFYLFFTDGIWDTIARNTNAYADAKRVSLPFQSQARPWAPTDANEIRVFVGLLIYMGIWKEQTTEGYWRTEKDAHLGPLHPARQCMGLIRFQQLKRYLQISPHTPDSPDNEPRGEAEEAEFDIEHLWRQLEPLISEFRSASERYGQPSTNISIDELIVPRTGRSNHTYKMQGHKRYVDIANQLRASCETHRQHSRAWWPLFLWVIDAAVANAWQISNIHAQHSKRRKPTQLQFRQQLFQALFRYRRSPTYQPRRKAARVHLPDSRLDSSLEHEVERRPDFKQTRCTWCLHINHMRQRGPVCLPVVRASLTQWNCKACKVPLCPPHSRRTCWKDFHSWVDSER